jgi:RNA recognition motif-containing protein
MTGGRRNANNESHAKLFVGNLPCNATDQELFNIFCRFGEIVEIHCLGSTGSRSGQACAFVKYTNDEAGRIATKELDGKIALRPYDDKAQMLQVRPARSSQFGNENSYTSAYGEPKCTRSSGSWVKLFIGNLPRDVTKDELNAFMRSLGTQVNDEETFILSGKLNFNNAVSAFVFVLSHDEASRAITLIDGRIALRLNGPFLKASLAHEKQPGNPVSYQRSGTSRAWQLDHGVAHPSNYGTGPSFLLPTPGQVSWVPEPSFKTYHHYMLMPQSPNYGPCVTPGAEPWRTNGIYSLPRATFSQPYNGQ